MNATSTAAVSAPANWLSTALEYAAEGIGVFPVFGIHNGACACGTPGCKDIGKHPRTGQGLNEATTDPEAIRRWAAAGAEFPSSGLGCAVPDGMAVIDIDPRNGGWESLALLEQKFGKLPWDRVAISGGDGLHYWFRVPQGMRLPGKLAPGVDVRQKGGYVVGAGSAHASGGTYRWHNRGPLPQLPAWIEVRPRAEADAPEVGPGIDVPLEAIEALAQAIAPLCVPGQKHELCWSLGSWLGQRGWSQAAIGEVIRRLPVADLRARTKDAYDGTGYAGGWSRLQALGAGVLDVAALDKATPNHSNYARLLDSAAIVDRAGVNLELRPVPSNDVSPAPSHQTARPLFRLVPDDDAGPMYRRIVAEGFDLARGCVTGVQARPRGGKTPFVLGLLFAVANGMPFHGLATERGRAALFTWEKLGSTQARKRSVAKALNVDPRSVDLIAVEAPLTLEIAAQLATFVQTQGYAVIGVDTLNSAMGSADQNEAAAATALKALSLALPDVAIVATVYERKSAAGGESDLANVAGSAAIAGAFDAAIRLVQDETSRTRFRVESTRELSTEPKPFTIDARGDENAMCFHKVNEVELAEVPGSRKRRSERETKDALTDECIARIRALATTWPRNAFGVSYVELTASAVQGLIHKNRSSTLAALNYLSDPKKDNLLVRGDNGYRPRTEAEKSSGDVTPELAATARVPQTTPTPQVPTSGQVIIGPWGPGSPLGMHPPPDVYGSLPPTAATPRVAPAYVAPPLVAPGTPQEAPAVSFEARAGAWLAGRATATVAELLNALGEGATKTTRDAAARAFRSAHWTMSTDRRTWRRDVAAE